MQNKNDECSSRANGLQGEHHDQEDPFRVGHALFILGDKEPSGVWQTTDWSFFNGMLLTVSFCNDQNHRILGSAVMVAPGIALTAKHVFESDLEDYKNRKHRATCESLTPSGTVIWDILSVIDIADTDIVILCLRPQDELSSDQWIISAMLSTRLPAIGEELAIVGFEAAQENFQTTDGNFYLEGSVFTATGKVSKQYINGRDKFSITWPVLEIECPTYGGMSGGPVFDFRGHLIGLACSSINISRTEGTSYISLLWQSLASRFVHPGMPHFYKGDISLIDLENRLCRIDNRSAIRTEAIVGDPLSQIINYRPWS